MKVKLNAPLVIFFAGLIAGIMVVGILAFNAGKQKPDAAMPYKWQSPALPEKMDFAGEPVPLERWEIREELDRQLLYNYYSQNTILYIMKLSNRYFPIIEERLKANGVPEDF